MCRDDAGGTKIEEMPCDRNGESRAFFGIRCRTKLVEQHQALRRCSFRDDVDVAHVRRECR